jgi:hypothetical protein
MHPSKSELYASYSRYKVQQYRNALSTLFSFPQHLFLRYTNASGVVRIKFAWLHSLVILVEVGSAGLKCGSDGFQVTECVGAARLNFG